MPAAIPASASRLIAHQNPPVPPDQPVNPVGDPPPQPVGDPPPPPYPGTQPPAPQTPPPPAPPQKVVLSSARRARGRPVSYRSAETVAASSAFHPAWESRPCRLKQAASVWR